ncbi:MAG: DUF971 domain-containing protein [Planctomycetota bacterium]
MNDAPTPADIRAERDQRKFVIAWSDLVTTEVGFRDLRGACPCANCVHELTGERLVGRDDVPEDVAPTELGLAGNYALKISWNDGHNTGLYRWEVLRDLGEVTSAVV